MTLRESFQGILDSIIKIIDWFIDGWNKLFNGEILDLTIGQAILVLFIGWLIFNVYTEKVNPLIKKDNSEE